MPYDCAVSVAYGLSSTLIVFLMSLSVVFAGEKAILGSLMEVFEFLLLIIIHNIQNANETILKFIIQLQ